MTKNELTMTNLVIGFGFLEGLWLAAGINPDNEIIKAFVKVLQDLHVSPIYIF